MVRKCSNGNVERKIEQREVAVVLEEAWTERLVGVEPEAVVLEVLEKCILLLVTEEPVVVILVVAESLV